MAWFRRDPTEPVASDSAASPTSAVEPGLVLVHALDGFLTAGGAAKLAAARLGQGPSEVVYSFDVDSLYDYRARRPPIVFDADHYLDYQTPRLDIERRIDREGRPFLLLAGPEPDFRWESFVSEFMDVADRLRVSLVLGLGAVPMGVPHTRPSMITAHGTSPDLVDRTNLWSARVEVPSSAAALLEYRMAQQGRAAAGYVVHVPHYLAQVDYPPAALALLDAVEDRLGLSLELDDLRAAQGPAVEQIEAQIAEQHGQDLVRGLEEQYDAFTRGAADSLLAEDNELPSGEELADQFEQFLARQRKDDQE